MFLGSKLIALPAQKFRSSILESKCAETVQISKKVASAMKGNDKVPKRLLLTVKMVERNLNACGFQTVRTAAVLSYTLSNL